MERDEDIIDTLRPDADDDAAAEPVRNAESLDQEDNTLRPAFVRCSVYAFRVVIR